MQNKIAYSMSPAEIQSLENHMNAIEELLKPHTLTLSPRERRYLSRATDSRIGTLERGLEHLEQNAHLGLSYVPQAEIRRDYEGKLAFDRWALRLETLLTRVKDTGIQSSHEFYREMRNAYNNARRMPELPGAVQFVELTSRIFKNRGGRAGQAANQEQVAPEIAAPSVGQ